MQFFTIGYGNRSQEELLRLLRQSGVRTVVDVRLRPDRAYMSFLAKTKKPDSGIQALLRSAEIDYVSLVELGNPFHAYEDWRERYRELLEGAGELLTRELLSLAEQEDTGPLCLLCAELEVEECHRLQIARYLEERSGWHATHL